MYLHVEHAQVMRQGKAWCGAAVIGPRVVGTDNFLYHSEQPQTAPICPGCISEILKAIGVAIAKTTQGG
jgi:hypothetical protein